MPKEYNAQGQEVAVGTIGNPYLYAGYRYDTETGLYFLKSRYYNPTLGRFISKDPLNAGSDTISVNPYVYARNNPVNLVDPTGQFDVYGQVLNSSGRGLAAAVRICNIAIQGGNYIQGDYGNVYYTDSSGRFKFTLIPEGIYNMYYDAEGYQSQVQQLITVTGNTQTPTVYMSRIGAPPQGHSGSGSNTSTSPGVPAVSNSSSYTMPNSTINVTGSHDPGSALASIQSGSPRTPEQELAFNILVRPWLIALSALPTATFIAGFAVFPFHPVAGGFLIISGFAMNRLTSWAIDRLMEKYEER